jgi:Ca2+-binding EF-hand superfamily protein
VFDSLDYNRDGKVDTKEVLALVHGKGGRVTDVQLKEWLNKYDTDKDGKISFDELIRLLTLNNVRVV